MSTPAIPISLDDLLRTLSRHVGKHEGVHVRELVHELVPVDSTVSQAALERHVRRLVSELRAGGHHICGHPRTGYYVARDTSELDATCRFLYGRAMSSLKQVAAMRRVSLPDLEGQLRLRT